MVAVKLRVSITSRGVFFRCRSARRSRYEFAVFDVRRNVGRAWRSSRKLREDDKAAQHQNKSRDPKRSDAYQLSVANALWAQKGFPFNEQFISINQQCYRAGLQNVDFVNETEPARKKINTWVEEKTQDKIKDLMPPGSINEMTRLVLTNAIYFKGQWADPFEKEVTADMPFFISAEKKVAAPLMMIKDIGQNSEYCFHLILCRIFG